MWLLSYLVVNFNNRVLKKSFISVAVAVTLQKMFLLQQMPVSSLNFASIRMKYTHQIYSMYIKKQAYFYKINCSFTNLLLSYHVLCLGCEALLLICIFCFC